MENNEIKEITEAAWKERVYIETAEHIVIGDIFMPKIGKKHRLLSEVLNGNKNFIAVKNCSLEYKRIPRRGLEQHDFMQINITSILIMRPANE